MTELKGLDKKTESILKEPSFKNRDLLTFPVDKLLDRRRILKKLGFNKRQIRKIECIYAYFENQRKMTTKEN